MDDYPRFDLEGRVARLLHLRVGEQLPAPRDVAVAEREADDRGDEEDPGQQVHAVPAALRATRTGSFTLGAHLHVPSPWAALAPLRDAALAKHPTDDGLRRRAVPSDDFKQKA